MGAEPYAVVQRKHKNKDGSKDILSKHYYVRFRVNGQLKYVRLNATKKKEAETVPPEEVRRQYFAALQEVKDAEETMKRLLVEGGYISE